MKEAQYIIENCNRLNEKWKKVELEEKGIKKCILSVKFKEKEVLEKFDTTIKIYKNKYTEFIQDKSENLKKIEEYIDKMEIFNSETNSNYPINKKAKNKK